MGQQTLGMYLASAPAYGQMFAAAGYSIPAGGPVPDALIDDLFVAGDAEGIKARLREIHRAGVDELMITIHPVADPLAEATAILQIVADLAREG